MPHRPPHGCAHPGCPELVRDGARCPDHERGHLRAQRAEADSLRPSSAGRGYGHGWRKLRKWYLPRHPVCVECKRLGLPADPHAVLEVDHIDGDVTNCALWNLRTMCKPHHSARTARDQAFGRRHHGRTPR